MRNRRQRVTSGVDYRTAGNMARCNTEPSPVWLDIEINNDDICMIFSAKSRATESLPVGCWYAGAEQRERVSQITA